MPHTVTRVLVLAVACLAVVIIFGQSAQAVELAPELGADKGPAPEARDGRMPGTVPELVGSGEVARANTAAFLEWAAASSLAQAEIVRKALSGARDNSEIAAALCEEAFRAQSVDNSRALVALALLGEMRSPAGEECLVKFVSQPLPTEGTVVEGEILERVALASLQAKAIDGLAYLGTLSANQAVLDAVGKHPSRIVRAEAIAAYLWNQKNASEARESLARHVRPDEMVFLDRLTREPGDTAKTFNPRLEAYLKAHPELRPPAPTQRDIEAERQVVAPPKFELRQEGSSNVR